MKIDFYSVNPDEIAPGCFTVSARTTDGRWWYHTGPQGFAYFTAAQADRLAWQVKLKGEINPAHWIKDGGTGYGTAEHEMELIELERSEAF